MQQRLAPPRIQTRTIRLRADVVVVGARCAGAAASRLLAQEGLDVVMVDRLEFPSDTLSTHAIARGGMVQLRRWGLLDAVISSGAPELRQVAFHSDGATLTRQVKDRHGVDFLVAPRRHILDRLLQEAATNAGVDFRQQVTVTGVTTDRSGRATGVTGHLGAREIEIDADFVIGADGLRSKIAREVGAHLDESRQVGGSTHYAYFPWSSRTIEYHIGDAGFAGVFPTHDDHACIWAITSDGLARAWRRDSDDTVGALRGMLTSVAPHLAASLAHCEPAGTARGVFGLPNQFRRPTGPGWALVGDAGYHRDAITGHGISDAFRDAELVAEAVRASLADRRCETDALSEYRRSRERLARPIFELTCEMSTLPGRERLVDLQRSLAAAIDDHAGELAHWPEPALATT